MIIILQINQQRSTQFRIAVHKSTSLKTKTKMYNIFSLNIKNYFSNRSFLII